MAITFPRPFPDDIYLRTLALTLVEPVKQSPVGGGGVERLGASGAYWRGTWKTGVLEGEQIGLVSAWLNSLGNGAELFLGRDTQRKGTYRHADFSELDLNGSTFDGETVLASVVSSIEITCRLPEGFTLVPGDRFQMVEGNWHQLLEVAEPVNVVSEGVVSVTFRAPLPVGVFNPGAVISFAAPAARMVLQPVEDPEPSGSGFRFTFSGRSI